MSFPRPTGLFRRTRKGGHRLAAGERSTTIVLASAIAAAEISALCRHVGLLLEDTEANEVICDVAGLLEPDAGTVDALARLQLTARRLGGEIRLLGACGRLHELLHLMGLGSIVLPCDELPLEARRQPEEREPSPGIQEEGDPADPIA
jgi:ABC-type transporter Mla MlaB component